jgi:hypothetical protein
MEDSGFKPTTIYLLTVSSPDHQLLFSLEPDGTSVVNRERLDEGAQLFFDRVVELAKAAKLIVAP